MNTCYSSRSHRLARFFSFGLLDGLHGIAVSRKAGSRRHGPLTISRASTPVTRLIQRVVDLPGAHKRGALYSSRRAPCEKPTGSGAPGVGGCQNKPRSQPLCDGIRGIVRVKEERQ
jgi:hypothetical protein